jgi:transposase-like protein
MEVGVRNGKDEAAVPAAFEQQIVELAIVGGTSVRLSREFGVAAQSISA